MSEPSRCRYCDELFEPNMHNQKFCTYTCRNNERIKKAQAQRDQHVIDDHCANCGHPRERHFNERGHCRGMRQFCACAHFRFRRREPPLKGKTLMQLHEEGKL